MRLLTWGGLVFTARGKVYTAWYDGPGRESIQISDNGNVADAAATASYDWEDGWGKLRVSALPRTTPDLAMFAAGYLEGYMTKDDMQNMFTNTYADWFVDGDIGANATAVYDWLEENVAWTRRTADQSTAPFWRRVSLVLSQLDGMAAGLRDAGSWLKARDVLLLNADGDLEELVPMLEVQRRTRRRDRCSALIKFAPDRSDIFFGHSTWDHYDMMVRTLKVYDMHLRGVGHSVVTFSSSPGFLSSIDDFFLTGNGLAVIETTNGISDKSLYDKISTSSILSWIRAAVANSLASSGATWVELFSTSNSGTYNNQWMILDLKLFTPGATLSPGTLTVLEQIPGYIEWRDMSKHLDATGYWGSYNVPAFPDIYKRSGFVDPDGHRTAPRANIFRHRQGDVTTFEKFQRLLRYNDWQHDPMSVGNACNAISARCDLNPVSSAAWQLDGGIDAKASTVSMAKKLRFVAQAGPTTYQQPPFDWRSVPPNMSLSHVGAPVVYDFTWTDFGQSHAVDADESQWSWNATMTLSLLLSSVTILALAARKCLPPQPTTKLEQKLLQA